jgi:hypothetical protein
MYRNHSGEALTINPKEQLIDKDGFIVHSVIQNILDGAELYCLYLADNVTFLPTTYKDGVYYDLNGKVVIKEKLADFSNFDEEQKAAEEAASLDFWKALFAGLFGDGSGAGGCNGCGSSLAWVFLILMIIVGLIAFGLVVKLFKWIFGK